MPPISGNSLNELGWQLADGQRIVFSQYNGTVLILDFYATWCLPCRQSIPELVSLQERYRDKSVSVVGLNVGGPDDWAKVPEFARELKIPYPLAVPDDELSNFLLSDDPRIPQTFVFDRDGKLLKRLIGYSENDVVLLEETVENALKNN